MKFARAGEENHENPPLGLPVLGLKYDARASQIQIMSATD
jgi:hypothetical protein